MDLLDVARQLEHTPLKDTSDGSTSWFDMRHEEGLAVDRWGRVLEHVVARLDRDILRFSVKASRLAGDGGLILHSHAVPGTTFSARDLTTVLTTRSSRGMVLVATTSHREGGSTKKVRYILDSRRGSNYRPAVSHAEIEGSWDQALLEVSRELIEEDDGSLSPEEGNAIHFHRVMERLCWRYGVEYRKEVLE